MRGWVPLASLVGSACGKKWLVYFRSRLDVFLIRNRETAVDRGGRSAPVLVELQAHGTGVDYLRDQSKQHTWSKGEIRRDETRTVPGTWKPPPSSGPSQETRGDIEPAIVSGRSELARTRQRATQRPLAEKRHHARQKKSTDLLLTAQTVFAFQVGLFRRATQAQDTASLFAVSLKRMIRKRGRKSVADPSLIATGSRASLKQSKKKKKNVC